MSLSAGIIMLTGQWLEVWSSVVLVRVMSLSRAMVVGFPVGAVFMAFLSSFSFLTCTAFSKEAPLTPVTNMPTLKEEISIITNKEVHNKEHLSGT
jgi:hypothetical protein